MRLTCPECGIGLDHSCACDSKPDAPPGPPLTPAPPPKSETRKIIEYIITGFHKQGHISWFQMKRMLSALDE